ncbi:hypothetical protein JCM6292_384 [Bacteroides pyogenes JCM 6292]|uniref:Uncharacterized protein n=2 Tax=Bacteroides pyogenes TaxID=310300 RepID=W4PEA4_9BACE|nr:hypothetical protein JCM6292_384 [Bacteroides pyogenes JCM 6292]GAE18035.1 hypothetical protein JCM6294_872 [Bacteroides pyogenes DSM 20611 = JCM 6294]
MKYNKKSIFLFEIIIKPISSENCIYNAYNKQNEKLFLKDLLSFHLISMPSKTASK